MSSVWIKVAVIGGGLLVVALGVGRLLLGRVARMVEQAATCPLVVDELDQAVPERLAVLGREVEALGLAPAGARTVTAAGLGVRLAQIHHVSEDGTVLLEAVCGFGEHDPPPLFALATPLAQRRGCLGTETHKTYPGPIEEVAQVLPGASPAEALDAHLAAARLLAARGVPSGPVGDPAVMSAWMHELAGGAFRADPRAARATTRRNLRRRTHEGLGPLAQHADLDERVAALTSGPPDPG